MACGPSTSSRPRAARVRSLRGRGPRIDDSLRVTVTNMLAGNLDTTNLLLGIMAAVSVLEALLLIGVGVMAWKLYRQAMQTVREVELRQIAPLVARGNTLMAGGDGILGDGKGG